MKRRSKSIILAPLEVLGVDKFADSAVIIKARFKTAPIQQWTVGREMNRRIKKKFDEVGIEIPFPHTSIYFGEASKPFQLQMQGQDREQPKEESSEKRTGGNPNRNDADSGDRTAEYVSQPIGGKERSS